MNFLNLDENCQNYCTVTVRYNGLESTSVGTWHSGGEGHSGLLSESDIMLGKNGEFEDYNSHEH